MPGIGANLEAVQNRIQQACDHRPGITLISVSKTKPIQDLMEAYQAGVRIFGENRVQEARDKRPQLPDDAEIHLIGPLQKNKAKYCPGLFTWIHSIHRLDVALELEKRCAQKGSQIQILIQMNLSGEESKSGLTGQAELQELSDQLIELPHLKLRGLMTMGDPNLSPEENRPLFRGLKELLLQEQARLMDDDFDQLSMGMSGDFEAALKEGATMIRVGSAIFGRRS